MKKPTVTIQHKISGSCGNNKCKDSAVAQQLTRANAMKAIKENNLK